MDSTKHTLVIIFDDEKLPGWRGRCTCGDFESTLRLKTELVGQEFDKHIEEVKEKEEKEKS